MRSPSTVAACPILLPRKSKKFIIKSCPITLVCFGITRQHQPSILYPVIAKSAANKPFCHQPTRRVNRFIAGSTEMLPFPIHNLCTFPVVAACASTRCPWPPYQNKYVRFWQRHEHAKTRCQEIFTVAVYGGMVRVWARVEVVRRETKIISGIFRWDEPLE